MFNKKQKKERKLQEKSIKDSDLKLQSELNTQVKLLLRNHDNKSALEMIDKCLRLDYDNIDSLKLKAICLIQVRNFKSANVYINYALSLKPDDESIQFLKFFYLYMCHWQVKEQDHKILDTQVIQEIKKKNQYEIKYYWLLAYSYYFERQTYKIKKIIKKLQSRFHNNKYLQCIQIIFESQCKNYSKTLDLIESTTISKYCQYQILIIQTNIVEQQKDDQEYLQFLNNLLTSTPNYYHLLNIITNHLNILQKYEDEIKIYKRMLQISQQESRVYMNMGVAYGLLHKYELELKSYNLALVLDQNCYRLYSDLGVVFGILKKYEKETASYLQALKLNPIHVKTLYNLGISYKCQHQYNQAIKYLEKTIKVDPTYIKAYYSLGNIYNNQQQYQKVVDVVNKVISNNFPLKYEQYLFYLYDLKSQAYYQMGKYNLCYKTMEDALFRSFCFQDQSNKISKDTFRKQVKLIHN